MGQIVGTSRTEIKRVGKFGLIGLANTAIDFTLYNLISSLFGVTLIFANVVSTTVAMIFSYVANRKLVFAERRSSRPLHQQLALFYLVSAFGVYVLQSAVILLLTHYWKSPVSVMVDTLHALGVSGRDGFLIKNIAKAAATIVSLTWNYILYKKVVFK